MHQRMSVNQIATTLAALSAASFALGDVAAARAPERVLAFEVSHAIALGESDKGDKGDDADKDKQKDKGKDKNQETPKKPAKKKGKKEHGSCANGGCGAGSCG